MRIALAGLGAAARRGHLPALDLLAVEHAVAVVGGCDSDPQRRFAIQQDYPSLPTFGSAAEMLAAVRPDLLVIATPPEAHAELAKLAATHEAHILCEKPAGLTSVDAASFTEVHRRYPERVLAAMYQYRFARPWILTARFLQVIKRERRAFSISVDIERPGTDRHALSRWRDNPAMGGALADHVVHFLALARVDCGPLRALHGSRSYDVDDHEHVRAHVRAGLGTLNASAAYGAHARKTSVVVVCGDCTLQWAGGLLTFDRGGRVLYSQAVPALCDREYVDSLYVPMYRDLFANLENATWRRSRARELLDVGQTLTQLLTIVGDLESVGSDLTIAA